MIGLLRKIEVDPNGAYLRDIVLVLKNLWPRKHTENTEYSQIISVSSVDSVAIYNDFDLSKRHSGRSVLDILYGE
jgi:hypothetical protein